MRTKAHNSKLLRAAWYKQVKFSCKTQKLPVLSLLKRGRKGDGMGLLREISFSDRKMGRPLFVVDYRLDIWMMMVARHGNGFHIERALSFDCFVYRSSGRMPWCSTFTLSVCRGDLVSLLMKRINFATKSMRNASHTIKHH